MPIEKEESAPAEGLITCPDKKAQCYDTQTCCLATDGSYECCPMPNVSKTDDGWVGVVVYVLCSNSKSNTLSL